MVVKIDKDFCPKCGSKMKKENGVYICEFCGIKDQYSTQI